MISDDLITTQFTIGDVEHDDTLKECFIKGVKWASRLERIKTLEEVREIIKSAVHEQPLIDDIDRLIAEAKESTNGN